MKRKHISKRSRIPLIVIALIVFTSLISAAVQPVAAASSSPSLTIVSVVGGKSVTIQAKDFPTNTAVTVRMSPYGSKGAGGTIVGTGVTASNGTLQATYNIPAALKSQAKIVVRVEATAKPSLYAYNWFSNISSSTAVTSTPAGTSNTGNITITDVEEDENVTFTATGAPAGAKLEVWFDWKNNSGALQGKQSGTVKVSSSGTVKATVNIPSPAKDRPSLRLRLQGINGGSYLAYRWFINADDFYSGSGSSSTYSSGLPFILVTAVVEDSQVSINAYNFPKGEYVVRMDVGGTSASGGIKVDTISIKENTTYTGPFNIPDDLSGEDTIAIRIQNVSDSRIYAYTSFENDTD